MEGLDRFEENEKRGREEIYSKAVRAGKRTYFFDVKSTRKDDYYLTITESKKRFSPDGKPFFEKHKLFLYKEDFEKFAEGFEDAVTFIRSLQTNANLTEGQPDSGENHEHFSDVNFEDLEKDI